MKLATFIPKAYWLVVEPVVKKVTQGGIHIPKSAQEPKVFKVLNVGKGCEDLYIGTLVMIDEAQAIQSFNEVEWDDHKGVTKLIKVHDIKGSWAKEETV